MPRLQDHLVSLAAAIDLEEAHPGYSEVNTDLPSGTRKYHESRIDKNGNKRLIKDTDSYEKSKRDFYATLAISLEHSNEPDWANQLFKSIKGYEGLTAPEKMVLFDKIKERKTRNEIARKVKDASTMEEKIQLLEDFHKEAKSERKITALNLKCMEEVREIRANELKRRKSGR